MSCKECSHSPRTYEEYCLSKSCPDKVCPDAFTERANNCGNYNKNCGAIKNERKTKSKKI
jgi:hypothetical protein